MFAKLRSKFSFIKRYLIVFYSKIIEIVNGPMVTGFMIENENNTFIVDAKDMTVGKILRDSGSYAVNERNLLTQLVNKDSLIIWAGTHIGALAIPVSKKVKKAIFIEANPNTFKLLIKNITLNNIDHIYSHNLALGEGKGKINFVLNKVNSGGSKREPINKENMYYYDNPKTVEIPMTDLDSLLEIKDLNQEIDLIFMDIEGSEYFALKGMQKSLLNTRNLVLEFIPHHLKNIANVSPRLLIEKIQDYFDYCYVPSKNKYIKKNEFINFFEKMYDKNESDDGIIFMKEKTLFFIEK